MIEAKLADKQLKVFDLIRLAGWGGKTCDEIEVKTGFTHQCASARVNELANWKDDNGREAPLIERKGVRRKTRTGRSADVYVLAGLTEAEKRKQDDGE
jgi:hypothetical protein